MCRAQAEGLGAPGPVQEPAPQTAPANWLQRPLFGSCDFSQAGGEPSQSRLHWHLCPRKVPLPGQADQNIFLWLRDTQKPHCHTECAGAEPCQGQVEWLWWEAGQGAKPSLINQGAPW